MTKLIALAEVVETIPDGATLMIGGILAVGAPLSLIGEIERRKKRDLTIIVNDAHRPGQGVGRLLTVKAAPKAIASHIGANPDAQRQCRTGRSRSNRRRRARWRSASAPAAQEHGFAYAPSRRVTGNVSIE